MGTRPAGEPQPQVAEYGRRTADGGEPRPTGGEARATGGEARATSGEAQAAVTDQYPSRRRWEIGIGIALTRGERKNGRSSWVPLVSEQRDEYIGCNCGPHLSMTDGIRLCG